ncbi:MAG: glycosyltransferase [Paludisphaera borealis]|uniref:glycosyltransferase n=1 Tax=Paludisphaera borealis TaxID=1387353 RepID=UPI002849BFEE|nr:glycosyltransferase [Paludisphaera borealis]MDR3621803.1 glycosyltransferase [Paludisphaera borealis]
MRISIAMTSYNSERFVGEQLESFAKQTRKPDEVVVCDDRSTDRTPEVLHEFAKNSPFPVRVVSNERQLGVTQNFDQAVRLCTGDLIFLSDHDDYWLPDKLALHESVHQSDPEVGLVISNAEICDEKLNSLGYTLFTNKRLGAKRLAAIDRGGFFDMSIRSPRVNGCTMSFTSGLREVALPLSSTTSHDEWLALILSVMTQTRCIEKPLMQYRTHATQFCGLRPDLKGSATEARAKEGEVERFRLATEALTRYFDDALHRVRNFEDRLYRKDATKRLEQKIAHLEARSKIGGAHPMRFALLAKEMLNGRYLKYSTKGSLVDDVKRCCRMDSMRA